MDRVELQAGAARRRIDIDRLSVMKCFAAVAASILMAVSSAAMAEPRRVTTFFLMDGSRDEWISMPPNGTPVELSVPIDDVTRAELRVVSVSNALRVRVRTPSGEWRSPDQPAAGGMEFSRRDWPAIVGPPPPPGPVSEFLLSQGTAIPGTTEYIVQLVDPVPGNYTLEIADAPGSAGGELVPVIMTFDGGVLFAADVLGRGFVQGRGVPIVAKLSIGRDPVSGATVEATVVSPSNTRADFVLRDGVGDPSLAVNPPGDYVARVPRQSIAAPGEYTVLLVARGQTAAGHPFHRTSSLTFNVLAAGAEFQHGLPVGEAMIRLVLSPQDCRLDKVEVRTRVDVQIAGAYRVEYDLVDAAGKQRTVGRRAELAVGTHDMLVSVDASDAQGLDLRGVIQLVAARLFRYDAEQGEELEVDTMPGLPASVERKCPR
jgi:hypothetical protein